MLKSITHSIGVFSAIGLGLMALPTFAEDKHASSFSEAYFDALLLGTQRAQTMLPDMTNSAEVVARLLVDGGDFYIASVRPDFMSEGTSRSGGFMFLQEYQSAENISEKDVVIVSWTDTSAENLNLIARLHESGAFIIGIGPVLPGNDCKEFLARTSIFLEASLPLPPTVTTPFKGETYPLISLQNLAILWTFSGEIVSALTRLGHMPTMYQSVLVTGARQRNSRLKGLRFHEMGDVPAVDAIKLGETYLQELASCFQSLRDRENGAFSEVSRAAAKTLRAGNNVHAFLIPHFPIYQHGAPGDPMLMQHIKRCTGAAPSTSELEENLKPGDLFMMFGYYRRPQEAYTVAHRRGVRIVEIITGTDEPETGGPLPDHVIRPWWPYGDSLVAIPGYDTKILPSSGILQTAIYWAVVGSTALELDSNDLNR